MLETINQAANPQTTEAGLVNAMQLARAQALAALRDGKPTGATVPNYNAGPEAVQRG